MNDEIKEYWKNVLFFSVITFVVLAIISIIILHEIGFIILCALFFPALIGFVISIYFNLWLLRFKIIEKSKIRIFILFPASILLMGAAISTFCSYLVDQIYSYFGTTHVYTSASLFEQELSTYLLNIVFAFIPIFLGNTIAIREIRAKCFKALEPYKSMSANI